MMLEDGWIPYEGLYPLHLLSYENGQIIENIPEIPQYSPPDNNIFSKLRIRRALRELDQENVLDDILESDPQIRADWNDANEINLADPVMQTVLSGNIQLSSLIEDVKSVLSCNCEL